MSDDYSELDARAGVAQATPEDPYADLNTRASGQEVSVPQDEAPKSGWQHLKDAVSMVQNHPFTSGPAMVENALSQTAGAVGRTVGRAKNLVTGQPMNQNLPDLSWQPHFEAGKQQNALMTDETQKISGAYDAVAGTGPIAAGVKNAAGPIGDALATAGLAKGAYSLAKGPAATPVTAPHPLQAAADAESSRISAALDRGRAAGMDLADRTVSPTQEAANKIVRQEFNLPDGAPITPKMLQAARETHYAPGYQAVAEVPKVKLGSAYEDDIGNVDTSLIKEKYRPPPGGSMTGAKAVELSKYLREKASAYFQEGTVEGTEKGQAHWDAAQAVEDAVERRLKATGQAQTAADWDNSRIGYAKTYSVESALDGAGNVVVPKLKGQLIRGKPLSGGLEDLATMGAANPEAFKSTPMKATPGIVRKIAAHSAPIVGAGAGSVLGPLGGAAGAAVGQHIGERILRP